MCAHCRSTNIALYTSLLSDGQSFLICSACLRRSDQRHARLQTLLSRRTELPVR
jgi:hypothetical protein